MMWKRSVEFLMLCVKEYGIKKGTATTITTTKLCTLIFGVQNKWLWWLWHKCMRLCCCSIIINTVTAHILFRIIWILYGNIYDSGMLYRCSLRPTFKLVYCELVSVCNLICTVFWKSILQKNAAFGKIMCGDVFLLFVLLCSFSMCSY